MLIHKLARLNYLIDVTCADNTTGKRLEISYGIEAHNLAIVKISQKRRLISRSASMS